MSETIISPWTLEAEIFIDDADGHTVCVPIARTAEGRRDCARLLAASPELLEAHKKAEAFVADELNVRQQSFMPEGSPYIEEAKNVLNLIEAAISKAEGK